MAGQRNLREVWEKNTTWTKYPKHPSHPETIEAREVNGASCFSSRKNALENSSSNHWSLESEAFSDLPTEGANAGCTKIVGNASEDGFDERAGRTWIYPTNVPVRKYQLEISEKALFYNTLVTLPTGLGKTLIAAVVMYNFYRWYPSGKVVFMAPTKPLVSQQMEACRTLMGIPQDSISEMTGSKLPALRKGEWERKRVFFLTPQVLLNDLSRAACPVRQVKCLVVDEAHRATGNHAYCEVIRELLKYGNKFRVLALSATPGSNIKTVQQVISNLLIAHLEIRTDDSPEIQQYTHGREIEKVIVPMDGAMLALAEKYADVLQVYLSRLSEERLLKSVNVKYYSKCIILRERERFRAQNTYSSSAKNRIEHWFSICITLYHGYELMTMHGFKSLYNYLTEKVYGNESNSWLRSELLRVSQFVEVYETLENLFNSYTEALYTQKKTLSNDSLDEENFDTRLATTLDIARCSHPKILKLIHILVEHFRSNQQLVTSTRVIIFSSYRDSVREITEVLENLRPLVRPMQFLGQSSGRGLNKGISQKKQLAVIKEFEKGDYNTLVATCVGEEGLDIGEVDLIVCYDAPTSPIRLVQRMGRTGRKRHGKILLLVTEGKEHLMQLQSESSRDAIHKTMKGKLSSFVLYNANPRMVPATLKPMCLQVNTACHSPLSKDLEKRVSCTTAQKRGDQESLAPSFGIDKKTMRSSCSKRFLLTLQPNDGALAKDLLVPLDYQDKTERCFLIEHSKICKALVTMVSKWGLKSAHVKEENNVAETSGLTDTMKRSAYQLESAGRPGGCGSDVIFNAIGIEKSLNETFACIPNICSAKNDARSDDEMDSIFEGEICMLADIMAKAVNSHFGIDIKISSTVSHSDNGWEKRNKDEMDVRISDQRSFLENVINPIFDANSSTETCANTCTDNVRVRGELLDQADENIESAVSLSGTQEADIEPANVELMTNKVAFDSSKVVFCEEHGELDISNFDLGFDIEPFGESVDQASQGPLTSVCSKTPPSEYCEVIYSPVSKKNSVSCFTDDESDIAEFTVPSEDVTPSARCKTAVPNSKFRRSGSSFILSQADVSLHSGESVSADEEEGTSDHTLDDPCFLDNSDHINSRLALTASQMRGVYVRSLNDSRASQARRLKLVFRKKSGEYEDTSSDGESEASTDIFDSFVVPNDFVEFEEASELECSVNNPKEGRCEKGSNKKRDIKKKRRVLICDTSDSDESVEVPVGDALLPKLSECKPTLLKSPVVQISSEPVLSGGTHWVPSLAAGAKSSENVDLKDNKIAQQNSLMEPVVLIGAHQISSAQHMASTLRTSFGITAYVCTLLDYDYVLSNRMVCKRMLYADFANPVTCGKVRKGLISLLSFFSRVVLLLEKDKPKNKFYTKETASMLELPHSKVVDNALASFFFEPRIKVVFADSVDDSAAVLAQLVHSEAHLGHGIQWDLNLNDRELQMLKFFRFVDHTTYVVALNLTKSFGSLEAVMRSNPDDLISKGKMLRHRAEIFYHFVNECVDTGDL
uniref:Fanconi anemia group M protein n=1 Tax=Trichuris muris TaxID=70415 RepID=A0A5S6QQQ2_TRIMR